MLSLYPSLLRPLGHVEIVDKRNRPIGITDCKTAARQRLLHRAAAIFLRDTAGRFTLSFQKNSGWGFSAVAPVFAGQSYETCADLILNGLWGIKNSRLSPLRIYPPCEENENRFVAIFEAALPPIKLQEVIGEPERYLLLDYDEFNGLNTHFSDMFSPYMRIVLEGGLVRP
jgi:isopentenyl-diphosphate delta-isomerase